MQPLQFGCKFFKNKGELLVFVTTKRDSTWFDGIRVLDAQETYITVMGINQCRFFHPSKK
jgi:hypothetical protein